MPCFCLRCNFKSYRHEQLKLQNSQWNWTLVFLAAKDKLLLPLLLLLVLALLLLLVLPLAEMWLRCGLLVDDERMPLFSRLANWKEAAAADMWQPLQLLTLQWSCWCCWPVICKWFTMASAWPEFPHLNILRIVTSGSHISAAGPQLLLLLLLLWCCCSKFWWLRFWFWWFAVLLAAVWCSAGFLLAALAAAITAVA